MLWNMCVLEQKSAVGAVEEWTGVRGRLWLAKRVIGLWYYNPGDLCLLERQYESIVKLLPFVSFCLQIIGYCRMSLGIA